MAHDVTLITGDGTGPELAEAARKCVDATGVKINWDVQEAGIDVMVRTGTPLPDAVMESVRRTHCALKAPITTPVGTGFRSINVYLRQALGLFSCIRPCKHYPGVRTFFESVPVDLVIVRENTESLYAGIEFQRGQAETGELIDFINGHTKSGKIKTGREETGITIKSISVSATERIVRYAFDYARDNKPPQSHKRPQGEHPEVHRRAVSGSLAAKWPSSIPTSNSRTGSLTTCACSWCRSRSCTTCWCCPICMATCSAIWQPGWWAGWAWRRERTSGRRGPCSRPPTAAHRSTRA